MWPKWLAMLAIVDLASDVLLVAAYAVMRYVGWL